MEEQNPKPKRRLNVVSNSESPVEIKSLESQEGKKVYEKQTQAYSTWGGKLLQHTDVLFDIQKNKTFKPITIQLAPTESCSSNCPFCSVSWRDVTKKIPWENIVKILTEFKELGAKSLEISGGGEPNLYKDGEKNINHIVELAYELGYEIGIITNTENLPRYLKEENLKKLAWARFSLIKLDEGKNPEDYVFKGLEPKQLGFSYIIYEGTTKESIEKIAKLVELNPEIKFVRIAADCLTEESITVKKDWGDVVSSLDKHNKFFIKEINDDFHAFDGGCWVGMLRPYVVWNGVYICTSHVLKHRNYHEDWKLCDHTNIKETWDKMNARFKDGKNPYDIDIKGKCFHCYYAQSNQILNYVVNELPDKNFA